MILVDRDGVARRVYVVIAYISCDLDEVPEQFLIKACPARFFRACPAPPPRSRRRQRVPRQQPSVSVSVPPARPPARRPPARPLTQQPHARPLACPPTTRTHACPLCPMAAAAVPRWLLDSSLYAVSTATPAALRPPGAKPLVPGTAPVRHEKHVKPIIKAIRKLKRGDPRRAR